MKIGMDLVKLNVNTSSKPFLPSDTKLENIHHSESPASSQTVPLFLLSLIHEMSMRCQPTSVSYLWVYRQTPQKLSLIICGYQVDAL